ncbi:hypothetical protein DFR50_12038 [Roseiarcus fermentans]|uniref:Uncharacterized protein n=1 Tax=Roseiarcus fermentans TaxID=1473586 RepID=A0A366F5B1_9HYPH|nr:hypothetical protein [Roseiarcus fermentans]RBP09838.1 hypothetical protein DFR50_12038 [Roseiarcus fermentans]
MASSDLSSHAAAGGRPDQTLKSSLGQVVLAPQGGGALGAYQIGVYEAPRDAGKRGWASASRVSSPRSSSPPG